MPLKKENSRKNMPKAEQSQKAVPSKDERGVNQNLSDNINKKQAPRIDALASQGEKRKPK